jgi:hypothetical protein
MILKIVWTKKLTTLTKVTALYAEKWIIARRTPIFGKNANFFAQNSDHNIYPCEGSIL